MIELNAIELKLDIAAKLTETEAAISFLSAAGQDIPAEAIELRTIMRRAIVAEERWQRYTAANLNPQKVGEHNWPRRSQVNLRTPAEHAIANAVEVTEAAGCHPLLTDAVVLLGYAREKVADFVELGASP